MGNKGTAFPLLRERFTSFSENMESNNPSGLKQNVCRYQSLPRDLNSGDISRCANTISTLESKISEGEKIKDQLQENLLFIFHECSPWGKQQAAIYRAKNICRRQTKFTMHCAGSLIKHQLRNLNKEE
jgi:hypothetical protein